MVQFDGVARNFSRLGNRVSTAPEPFGGGRQSSAPVPFQGSFSGGRVSSPPVPIYSQPGPATPIYPAPAQNMPTNYGKGFDGTGGNAEAGPQVNNTPANPPVDYSKFSTGDLSAMDSTLADQLSLFAQALKRYTADDTRQREDLGSDKDLALGGIGRNEISGLTGLNEDFAARGLGRSGLLFDAQNKAREAFGRQKNNVNTQYNKGIDNLDMKLRNFKAENGAGGSNEQAARRDALARLAAKQSLV